MVFSNYIDHTLLKAEATEEEILKLCSEAKKYDFMSVCVNPSWVKTAKDDLNNSGIKVCTVVGFPLGATSKSGKIAESLKALEDGAEEIDMVINIGRLKSGDYKYVEDEIRSVVEAVGKKALVKVIIETCLLDKSEKEKACQLAKDAGADYVKTSTGFSKSGASLEDIRLMKAVVGDEMGIKASGGIRSLESAIDFIEAGATRLGLSAGVEIMEEFNSRR